MDRNFKNKTIVITGGSEGVGAATARKFAALGANLVLVARNKKNLDLIAGELRQHTKVMTVPMDVTDELACDNLFKKAKFDFGGIHVLVNNAGYHSRGTVAAVPAAELARIIDVNLRAPVVLCRLALPYLSEAGQAAIINVASLAGRIPVAGAAAYSASKFGLRAFTFALADELRGSGIKVAAVSPGPIDTGFIMTNIDDVADVTFSQPLSTADEVADVIVDLCCNGKRERSMPPVSGLLTTTGYLLPGFMKLLRPLMIRKGRRVKAKLKATRK